eukprot:scaffold1640_cov111-Isochrysis_galbana.AAC.21
MPPRRGPQARPALGRNGRQSRQARAQSPAARTARRSAARDRTATRTPPPDRRPPPRRRSLLRPRPPYLSHRPSQSPTRRPRPPPPRPRQPPMHPEAAPLTGIRRDPPARPPPPPARPPQGPSHHSRSCRPPPQSLQLGHAEPAGGDSRIRQVASLRAPPQGRAAPTHIPPATLPHLTAPRPLPASARWHRQRRPLRERENAAARPALRSAATARAERRRRPAAPLGIPRAPAGRRAEDPTGRPPPPRLRP